METKHADQILWAHFQPRFTLLCNFNILIDNLKFNGRYEPTRMHKFQLRVNWGWKYFCNYSNNQEFPGPKNLVASHFRCPRMRWWTTSSTASDGTGPLRSTPTLSSPPHLRWPGREPRTTEAVLPSSSSETKAFQKTAEITNFFGWTGAFLSIWNEVAPKFKLRSWKIKDLISFSVLRGLLKLFEKLVLLSSEWGRC